ncbi:MAG: type II secretion system F family protein [Dehalococcoidia bacterium]
MDFLALVASFSVMLTVLLALMAFYGTAVPQATAVRGRLEGLMSGTSVVDIGSSTALRRVDSKSLFRALVGVNLREKLQIQLERADLTIAPSEYVLLRIALALAGFVAPIFFLSGVQAYLAALAAALIGYNLPKFYLKHRRQARVDKLNAQLPEALMAISNSLKAGFGLLQALNTASDQLQHPISTELARTIHEMNIGSSAEEALVGLSDRSGSYDLDIVVTAILVQRTVGGNLGEILDNVAETMRERIRIKGEIQTLTAQQKLTGIVLGLLPVAVGVLFLFISPGYMNPLWETTMGKTLLGGAAVMEVVGVMIIQRILKIEV